jgi:hypothetical protein
MVSRDAIVDDLQCRFHVVVVAAFEDAPTLYETAAAQLVMERLEPAIKSAIRAAGFRFPRRALPDPNSNQWVRSYGTAMRGRYVPDDEPDDEFPF